MCSLRRRLRRRVAGHELAYRAHPLHRAMGWDKPVTQHAVVVLEVEPIPGGWLVVEALRSV